MTRHPVNKIYTIGYVGFTEIIKESPLRELWDEFDIRGYRSHRDLVGARNILYA